MAMLSYWSIPLIVSNDQNNVRLFGKSGVLRRKIKISKKEKKRKEGKGE
jgi:hypothetical protein|tara:strand:- start:1112 stop:1258 length:147 start_codon:yes stop_codon:yes gene_type:complete